MTAFSDEILFVHIPKTGGTAARHYLKRHVPGTLFPEDHDYPFPIGHIPLRDIETFSGRSPESFEKIFAIIRDPYEQQLSQWLFWWTRHATGGEHYHDVRAAKYSRILPWLLDTYACDFHVWYDERVGGRAGMKTTAEKDGYLDFGSYYLYWLALPGRGIPSNVEIIRFEEMNTALPKAVEPWAGGVHEMPVMNRGPRRKPVEEYYYDPRARRVVEEKFSWAFENYYERMGERGVA